MEGLSVPVAFTVEETEVKKSRFIAWADNVATREDAMTLLEKAKQQFPDARHHCWAYVIENGRSAAASDDGEPSGTAGKPILNVLQHKHVTDIMIIVIRYFGGIKLGAGGLVRAYSGAAQAVMEKLPLEQPTPVQSVVFYCDFSQEAQARYWAEQCDGSIAEIEYDARVKVTMELPADRLGHWREQAERHVEMVTKFETT